MSTPGGDEERCFVGNAVRVSLGALLALGCALVVMSCGVGTALAATAPSWTPSVKFDPAAGTTHPVTGLSCTGSGFCLAVDSAGRTFAWTGSWHASPGISRSVQYVVGLSCVSSSFCVAIGSEGKPASSSSYAVTWNGARWEAPVRLYYGTGEAALYGTVKSVWCTSKSFCIAVGGQVGSIVFNGSRWTSHAGSTSGTDGQGVVGCSSSRFCIDIHDDFANYWNGSSWRWNLSNSHLTTGAIPDMNSFAFGISCVKATFCVAAAGAEPPIMWNGENWRFAPRSLGNGGGFASVSCTSTAFCVAGGQADRAAVWNGSTWAFTAPVNLPDAPVLVSCSKTGSCLAVSADGSSAHTKPTS
jgi:hypothetical protein